MEIINEHSAEWRNFVKNDNRIYKAMYRATTAFANLQPLPEPAIVLGRRYYRHEILCRDKLARYSCNNTECALWDGEILTMAWSAFSSDAWAADGESPQRIVATGNKLPGTGCLQSHAA